MTRTATPGKVSRRAVRSVAQRAKGGKVSHPSSCSMDAAAALGPMLTELTACMFLPADDPRRAAAVAEKRRVLALIETSPGR